MIYPAPDKLDKVGSKYALVIVAAKRAKQVRDGARRLVDSKSTNPLTVALEELAQGQITMVQIGEPEALPTSLAATPVLGGLLATYDDELGTEGDGHGDDFAPLVDDGDDIEAVAADEEESPLTVAVLGEDDGEDEQVVPRTAEVEVLGGADEEADEEDGIVVVAVEEDELTAVVMAVGDSGEDDPEAPFAVGVALDADADDNLAVEADREADADTGGDDTDGAPVAKPDEE